MAQRGAQCRRRHNLIPTFRSVGFASWLDQLGRIEYVDSRDAEQGEFFVPRVIERFNLGRKPRENSDRFFPEQALKANGSPSTLEKQSHFILA